jgi:hypothetical protein
MLTTVLWLVPATILLAAAALKAADRRGTTVAVTTYGVPGRLAAPTWGALVAVEAALAAGIAAGSVLAAQLAGGLLTAFVLAQVVALARGGEGAPCGCFGRGGRLSRATAGRTALLACACAALPLVPGPGLPLTLTGALTAVVVVLVSGRRSGRPGGALELAGEGPPLDAPSPLAAWFPEPHATVLAVFTTPGCGLCRRVAGAADALTERGITVRRFDEVGAPDAWAAARVPGAPYAVALGPDGHVLAKGTVNDGAQLESVLAAAESRGSSRRAFLARAGALAGAGVVASVVPAGEAEAHHFCGHTYTTDSCPHPTGLPRIDRRGFPLRAADGRQVDDLGRLIDKAGRPVDEDGVPLTDLDGRPLPAAPRTPVCKLTGQVRRLRVRTDGAWYRCCGGRVRKLTDCCSPHRQRINGDKALKGYCYDDRKVFCVMYFQSSVPC